LLPIPDLQVTDRSGTAVSINLAGATTLGDVQTKIQTQARQAGVDLVVQIDTPNRRLLITDRGPGTGILPIQPTTLSHPAADAGLAGKQTFGTTMVGDAIAGAGNIDATTALNTLVNGGPVRINTGVQDRLFVGTNLGVYQTSGVVLDVA